jgi:excinuclease ABC subunit A
VEFDPELVVVDPALSIAAGAVSAWKGEPTAAMEKQQAAVAAFLAANELTAEMPVESFKPAVHEKLFRGDGKKFVGLLTLLEQEFATATDENRRTQLELFRGRVVCSDCQGDRLQPIARSVRLGKKTLPQATQLSIVAAKDFFAKLKWNSDQQPVAQPLISEVTRRLEFLAKVGLGYLTLDRPADTLSGGELQRVRLATGIGSGLVGVCYILDEPSIGLHPRDNDRLIAALRELQQQGNTVIVVEHDAAMMLAADWLVDIGPGAGREGGHVVAQGTPAEVMACETSPTGNYLSGRQRIEIPQVRRPPVKGKQLTLEGVTTNNLQNVTVNIPLGLLVGITGVSGSGKSSLINETLAPALSRKLRKTAAKPGPFTALKGLQHIDQVIIIDQEPLGRSPRSNAATYTGVFDEIRKVFALTKEAKQLGFKANRFSFNAAGGRCEECLGHGVRKIEMNFLPDIYVTCTACHGSRFNRGTLQVKYKQKSIAEVLTMSCREAAAFFHELDPIHRPLQSLCDVGLGYLPIGQAATTLSGGESQRVKLATELAHRETGRMVYILDEPTTGLHFDDVRRLLAVLQQLVDRGHTVIVVEHHVDVMLAADWLIDLGPDGGSGGGRIVATGTPEEVAVVQESATGRALRQFLT